jgi:hypothetical protein
MSGKEIYWIGWTMYSVLMRMEIWIRIGWDGLGVSLEFFSCFLLSFLGFSEQKRACDVICKY